MCPPAAPRCRWPAAWRSGEHRVDADALRPLDEVAAVGAVSVTDQETRAVSPRRGIDELPPDPGRRRMCGDVDVHHRAAIVRDEEEDVERVEPERVHREEVRCPDLRAVVLEERAPARQRVARDVLPIATHRQQADPKAELAQLSEHAHVPPAWILLRHPPDQLSEFWLDARATTSAAPTLPSPVATPHRPMPAHHGVWLHDHDVATPTRPHAGE